MAARSTFPIFDQAHGGTLEKRLREWRATDPPLSFDEIAYKLRTEDVALSGETVRRWCDELGIPRRDAPTTPPEAA